MSNIRLLHCLGLLSLLCVTGSGSALTIGRQQGQAVFGRPVEVQVPVVLDAGMDPAELCPEAEVSYGESRLNPRLVSVQVSGSGETVQVRVRATPPLDEPFVALQLRVGCGQRLTRRFVLLADEPAGDRPPVLATAPVLGDVARAFGSEPEGGPAGGASIAPASGSSNGASHVAPSGPPVAPAGAMTPVAPSGSGAGAASRPVRPRPTAAAALPSTGAERPRLRLDPVDIRLQGASPAASTAQAAAGPAVPVVAPGPASPASAAASGVADTLRTLALEAEIRKLQEALQNSRVAAAELRARTVEAERERYANPLVLGLAAVATLSLLLAGLAWRRATATGRPSGRFSPLAERSASIIRTPQRPVSPAESARPSGAHSPNDAGTAPDAPVLTSVARADGADAAVLASERADGMARNLASMNARLPEPLHLSTHELNDIQQEADFFVSLGDYDRAIEVLQNHIQLHPQSSALAWLDLMQIQHKLGRKDAYDQLRRDFEWLFNAEVPSFENFDADHDDLEGHPELLARIQAAWPEPEVLKVIDAAIFRTPTDDKGKPLGLQAYRDLLFLHQVLRSSAAKAPEAGASASPAVSALGAAAGGGTVSAAARALASLPASSQRLARDLDFDLEEVLAQPAAAPDPTREPNANARDPESQERFSQGLDALLNFDLEPLELKDEAPTGVKAEETARQRAG